jgi:hypothetical protein
MTMKPRNDLKVFQRGGELVIRKRRRPRPRPRNDTGTTSEEPVQRGFTSLGDLAKLLMAAAALKAAGGTNGPLVITQTRRWTRGMEDEED